MKKIVLTLLVLTLGLISCGENNSLNTSDSKKVTNHNIKTKNGQIAVAGWRWYVGPPQGCIGPGKGCIPADIVVTPKAIEQLYNLDAAIAGSTIYTFFADSTNYDTIFPGLYGQALTDLRNGSTSVFRANGIGADSIATVGYVLHRGDTLLDYTPYY